MNARGEETLESGKGINKSLDSDVEVRKAFLFRRLNLNGDKIKTCISFSKRRELLDHSFSSWAADVM